MYMSWTGEDIEKRLYEIMKNIRKKCVQYGTESDDINYRKGALITRFAKVANAMTAWGNIKQDEKRGNGKIEIISASPQLSGRCGHRPRTLRGRTGFYDFFGLLEISMVIDLTPLQSFH
jgi:hypothetical protein